MRHVDLRLASVATCLWLGMIGAYRLGLGPMIALCSLLGAGVGLRYLTGRFWNRRQAMYWIPTLVTCLVATCLGAGLASIHEANRSPVIREASHGRLVTITGRITSYPSVSTQVYRGFDVESLDGEPVRGSVRLVGEADLASADLGERISARVRLDPGEVGDEHLAWARVTSWEHLESPRGIEALIADKRAELYASLDGAPLAVVGLVPGLAIGDDSMLPEESAEAMQGVNLTHLTAVSGAHVSMICAIVLGLIGARRRFLAAGASAATLLVLLVATGWQPSVMRAGVMGGVVLLALILQRPRAALPALGMAIMILLCLSPPMALSYGFILSVVATAAILLVSPWAVSVLEPSVGRPLAHLIAVPLVAHLACSPVLASLSDTSSIWSALANALAAPVVPAGTVTALLALLNIPVLSGACLVLAKLAVHWIDIVGRTLAAWPGSDISSWLVVATYVAILGGAWLVGRGYLRRRWILAGLLGTGLGSLLMPRPWDLLACDVGQGTAILYRDDHTYLIDTGTEDSPLDRCLRRHRASVDVLILTHLHDDHAGHAPRLSQEIPTWVGPGLTEQAEAMGIAVAGELHAGDVLGPWHVVWPATTRACRSTNCENDQSLVLRSRTSPSILVTGDIEEPAQRALAGTQADIVIVPHHGSPNADDGFIEGLRASHAIISVGENSYGHPAPHIVDLYGTRGQVEMTRDGDVSVVMGY